MKYIYLILLCFISMYAFPQDGTWKKTVRKDTKEGYTKFLEKYPSSHYAKEAKLKIEQFDFEEAQSVGTIDSYKSYIEKYPSGTNVKTVRKVLVTLESREAKVVNTIDSYDQFIDTYRYEQDDYTQKKILEAEYLKACRANTSEAYENFLKKHPDNKYSTCLKGINLIPSYSSFIEAETSDEKGLQEMRSLADTLESIGDKLALQIKNEIDGPSEVRSELYRPSIIFYTNAAEFLNYAGNLKSKLNEDPNKLYKKSGYYYYSAASSALNAERIEMFISMKKGDGKSVEEFKSLVSEAMVANIPLDLSKVGLYQKSVELFRQASLEEHADWMMEGNTMKSFDLSSIKGDN